MMCCCLLLDCTATAKIFLLFCIASLIFSTSCHVYDATLCSDGCGEYHRREVATSSLRIFIRWLRRTGVKKSFSPQDQDKTKIKTKTKNQDQINGSRMESSSKV